MTDTDPKTPDSTPPAEDATAPEATEAKEAKESKESKEAKEAPAPEAEAPKTTAPKAETPKTKTTTTKAKTPKVDAPTAKKPSTRKQKPASSPTAAPKSWTWGLGRRKASVARVRIRPGDGKFIINKREFAEYFNGERDRKDIMNVLEKTSMTGKIDIYVNVNGGGFTGQAGAILLGLGRAIMSYDQTLEPILRDNNFLTRDPRRVERKKYGQPKARKRFQFSKR